MSTIGLKYHNEDIHNIIRKPMSPILKSPRHESKRKFHQKQIFQRYNGHQTFGLAQYEAPESKNFLKKGKLQAFPQPAKPGGRRECNGNCKSGSIPKPITIKKHTETKNFVKENMKKVMSLQPKVPVPRRVETPRGTVKDLAHLLQMIKIRESEAYGRIPKYLSRRKNQLSKAMETQKLKQEALQQWKDKMGIGTMGMGENVYMVDKNTRQQILDGLKENWNELSIQFLKLPVMTDTLPKIKRKMYLEREIEQLERDIRLVETHPYIYLEGFPKASKISLPETSDKKEAEPQGQQEESEKQETEAAEKKEPEALPALPALPAVPSGEEIQQEKKDEDKETNIYNC